MVDTAVKTAATGYISRRLVKVMESIAVRKDLTVRTAGSEIIQFCYGGDNLDATYLEKVRAPYLMRDQARLRDHFLRVSVPHAWGWKAQQRRAWSDRSKREAQEASALWHRVRSSMNQHTQVVEDHHFFPVNVDRMLRQPQYFREDDNKRVQYFDYAPYVAGVMEHSFLSPSLQLYLRHWLCGAVFLRFRLSQDDTQRLCAQISALLKESIIAHGEMVGAIASSSIGEPCTQMTLNTFHSAGIATKNITLGIPRFKELIDVSKNIKTPSLTIYLNEPLNRNQSLSSMFAMSIQHTMLKAIVDSSQLLYEKDIWTTGVDGDQLWLDLRKSTQEWEEDVAGDTLSNWVIRFVLNCEKMERAGLTMECIEESIQRSMKEKHLHVVCSDQNSLQRILRVRMYNLHEKIQLQHVAADEKECVYLEKISMQQLQNHLIDTTYIQGLANIKSASTRQVQVSRQEENDGSFETHADPHRV